MGVLILLQLTEVKRELFRTSFVLLVVVAFLFFVGEAFYLRWTFWWFDVVLHFLGGLCVAMGGLSTWLYLSSSTNISNTKLTLVGLLWALAIGIIWEIFEVHFGITFLSDGIAYVRDTASDLIMDICGGIFGVLYAVRLNKQNEQ